MLRPYMSLAIRRPPPQRCDHAHQAPCAAARCRPRHGQRRRCRPARGGGARGPAPPHRGHAARGAERQRIRPDAERGHGLEPRVARRPAVRHRQHPRRPAGRGREPGGAGIPHRALGDWALGSGGGRDAARGGGDPLRGVLQRPLRRADPGDHGDVRQPALPQRRGRRDAPADPLPPHGVGRDGHRHVRQGAARDDARARGMRKAAGRDRSRRRHAPGSRGRRRGAGAEPGRPVRAGPGEPRLCGHMGCRACGSAGGGCQFLGTAATSQVVAEALGLALPHSALAPSGEPAWLELGPRTALALLRLHALGIPIARILTQHALENAMLVHAAFGGSTNLLLHIPAIAHAAGLRPPTLDDWIRVNRATPRLVDALPNGPRGHPTVQVFMAGGVPEVMLHLRRMGLLHGDVVTATGDTLDATLDWWETSDRRREARARLAAAAAVAPDDVIVGPGAARRAGLTSTVVFPVANLAPEGAVIKATSLDPSIVGDDQVYRHRGPARVFVDERDAIRAVKGVTERPIRPGDVMVLIGTGPSGTGMQETAQITTALRYLPWGKQVALLTDGRFSGFSSGACVGHIGPEALHGGPIGRLRDDDLIEIVIDRGTLTGSVNLVGAAGQPLDRAACTALLEQRAAHPGLAPHPALPADTRLWAALQRVSGGTWAGCVYDVDRIVAALEAGLKLTKETT